MSTFCLSRLRTDLRHHCELSRGVQPFDHTTAAVVAKLQFLLRRIDVAHQLAGGINFVAVDTTMGPFAFYEVAASVIAEVGLLSAGIDAFAQATLQVVVVQRLVVAAVAIAEQLVTVFQPRCLVFSRASVTWVTRPFGLY